MSWRRWMLVLIAIAVPVSSPARDVGYTHTFEQSLFRMTIPFGSWQPIATVSGEFLSFALSDDGQIFALSWENELVRLDPSTGTSVSVGLVNLGPSAFPTAIEFDRNGRLLLLANAHPQSALYELDPETAASTLVLWLDSDQLVYIAISGLTCYASSGYKLYLVDLMTGALTERPGTFGWYYGSVGDLAFDSMGQLYGIENTSSPIAGCVASHLVKFDLVRGEITRVAELPMSDTCYYPLAIQPGPSLPVPTQGHLGHTLLIFAVAGIGVAVLMRR